jgi:hypothetical protein
MNYTTFKASEVEGLMHAVGKQNWGNYVTVVRATEISLWKTDEIQNNTELVIM